eukprot:TRINITY_DN33055_c0_g1_i2.p1 TRINITY_DN33055_c0_g1~~TRINITY_DN33055_c0_g1_i2.p1  ORF type:complete len:178 (+),score=54.16 TRINITY_DN33055_c0_g1_i2:431-964(+)
MRSAQEVAKAAGEGDASKAVAAAEAALARSEADAEERRLKCAELEKELQGAQVSSQQLGEKLHELAGVKVSTEDVRSLPEAMALCKAAVPYLQQAAQQLSDAQARVARAEADLLRERDLRQSADEALSRLPGTPGSRSSDSSRIGMSERSESLLGGPAQQTCVQRIEGCRREQCVAM